jgi:hypothetical protein
MSKFLTRLLHLSTQALLLSTLALQVFFVTEAGISRIYGSIHFLAADVDSLATGTLGNYVFDNFLAAEGIRNETAPSP